MTAQPNCEQRILESYQNTAIHISAMLSTFGNEVDDLDPEDEYDAKVIEAIENDDINENSLFEYALGVDIRKSYKIHLSTGGPASFIEVITTEDDEIIDMYYHFQDWFDGAKTKIDEDSSLYRYAMLMLESSIKY